MEETEPDILPWHLAAVETLAAAGARGRLGHAWLIHGPAGLGKRRLAETLAAALLRGIAPAEWSRALPRARSLADGPRSVLPDLHRLEPLPDKHTIGIDQVRALIEQLGYTSHGGGARVAIVALAEQLTTSAANSLLKTLEEPPAGAYLLLVSHEPGRLPATIRSRCQRIAVPRPDEETALAWLATVQSGRDWRALLGLAGGCPLRALEFAQQERDRRDRQWCGELASLLAGRAEGTALVDGWLREDAAGWLGWLQTRLEGLIRDLVCGDGPREDAGREYAELLEVFRQRPPAALFALRDGVSRLRRLADGGVNTALVLEALVVTWRRALV
jgi:DNA polymerase III subunit delta'